MERSLENSEVVASDLGGRMVQSVDRAFAVLRVLSVAGRPMSLSEIARRVTASKPAVYHLLRTLVHVRALSKTPDGLYVLGWGLWELGSTVVRRSDVTRTARFHLDRLAEQTEEAALLSILDGASVLYLDRGQSSSRFELVANIGRRSSLHGNASGKVLLAYSSESFIDDILSSPLRAFTTASITDRSLLREELARVRADGFAVCWQEQEAGMSSLGAPIRVHSGEVVAALALAGPAVRVNPQTAPRLLDALVAEADAISAGLGARFDRR